MPKITKCLKCLHTDLIIYYENGSFFWTFSMPISAKLRDLGIEEFNDKTN